MRIFCLAERGLHALLLTKLLLPRFKRTHYEDVLGRAIKLFLKSDAGRMSSYTRISMSLCVGRR